MFNPNMTLQVHIYHHFVALVPTVVQNPSFLSVYIFDLDLERQTDAKVEAIGNPILEIFRRLSEMLQAQNP